MSNVIKLLAKPSTKMGAVSYPCAAICVQWCFTDCLYDYKNLWTCQQGESVLSPVVWMSKLKQRVRGAADV